VNEDLLEIAALEALELDAAPHVQAEVVKLHPSVAEARRDFDRVVELLAYAAPPVAPPPSVKERLFARIAEEEARPKPELPEGAFVVKDGVIAIRTEDVAWKPSPLKGVDTKVLHRDPDRGYTTRLLRLQRGAGYPYHKHAGWEEIYVLEGSVTVNGLTLKAGDFCLSAPGSDEFGTYSETGGMAIVISCDRDEVKPRPEDLRA